MGWTKTRPNRPAGGMVCMATENGEDRVELNGMNNPWKEEECGHDFALQYGVADPAREGAGSQPFFSSDTKVIFGVNSLEIGLVELHNIGLQRPLLVTGWNQARADPVVWELLPRGLELAWHSIPAQPSAADVVAGADKAMDHRADCLIAMGGGSVMDAGKVIAALTYAGEDHHLAVQQLLAAATKTKSDAEAEQAFNPALVAPIPLVTIPLTMGLGSEVTPMARVLVHDGPGGLADAPHAVTVGFSSTSAALPAPFMALVEPRLAMRLRSEDTWPRAFAALAGCLEVMLSGGNGDFVRDMLAHEGARRVAACLSRTLPQTDNMFAGGASYLEREDIAFASVCHGLAAPRTGPRWGLLDTLAEAVSAESGVPHALAVARLLPRVLEAQIAALQDAPAGTNGVALLKLSRAAGLVSGAPNMAPENLVSWLDARLQDKNVTPLGPTGTGTGAAPGAGAGAGAGGGGGGGLRRGDVATVVSRLFPAPAGGVGAGVGEEGGAGGRGGAGKGQDAPAFAPGPVRLGPEAVAALVEEELQISLAPGPGQHERRQQVDTEDWELAHPPTPAPSPGPVAAAPTTAVAPAPGLGGSGPGPGGGLGVVSGAEGQEAGVAASP